MVKPAAVRQFDLLYLGGYVVALVGSLLGRGAAARAMAAAGLPAATGPVLYGSAAFGIVVIALLWFFTSARHSGVAKWIAIAFVLLGLLSGIRGLTAQPMVLNGVSLAPDRTATLMALIGGLIQAVGLQRLFTPGGRSWFTIAPADNLPDQRASSPTDWSVRRD